MTDSVTNTDELDPTPPEEVDTEDALDGEGAPTDEGGAPDDDVPEADAAETVVAPSAEEETEALRGQMEELNDRHLRLVAEFTNYRRRVEQERREAWGRAQADLVAALLDVLDDLQRVAGLDLSNASVEGIMEGIDLVERKFVRKILDAGAEVIAPQKGEPFDPERMEAVMRAEAESEEEDETVAQLFQKGYAFKGQLVRPAKVSVAKHDG